MGTKHEQAIETILGLRNELSNASKDLPWLNQRHYELEEENIVQYNEIQSLKVIQQKYDELLCDVSVYGMTAKRPEYYQQMCEKIQRQLEISNYHLQRSEKSVKALKEKLEAQHDTAEKEKDSLRAQLKKNSRSAAYWAKFRRTDITGRALESKPAWGVRCACTDPEIAFGLEHQAPRIAELEATVAARDRTITRLQTSHESISKDETSSASNTAKTTHLQACEHEQQCKHLEDQVADDAKTLRQLRKECQDLKDAASNVSTADTAEADAKATFEELAAKDAIVKGLREELAAKDTEIDNLREEKRSADETATTAHEVASERERQLEQQQIRVDELEATKSRLEDAVEKKDLEIEELEDANQEIAERPAPESAETVQRLQAANTNLA